MKEDKPRIVSHLTQMPGKGLRGVKNTIAVASGKGGVGKSTTAVNLAIALAQSGARVGLLDADIYGPSIPSMLGPHQAISIENNQYLPIQAHGIQAMSIGYITENDEALIWRGPMLAKALMQLINDTAWDDLDYLFIDLPPGTGDIQLSLVQRIPLTGAIIVTTPQHIATMDAEKAIQLFIKTNIHVLGLVENMTTHICSACGHNDPIFGQNGAKKMGERFELPLLGQLPLTRSIQEDCDRGEPSVAILNHPLRALYLQIATQIALNIAKLPVNYANKFPDIVVEN